MGSIFSSPKAPPAPDPAAAAQAQGAANLETAIAQGWLGAMNQSSPYGNVSYSQVGTQRVGDKDVPQFQQNITLSPEQQAQFNLSNRLQTQALGLGQNVLGNVGNAISTPFSYDGLPQLPGADGFSADRDAMVNALIQRNQPMMDRQRAGQENQLANQGIMRGSEAWKNASDDLGRQENDFRLAALAAGGQEQSRMFGLANQARQQGIQERAYARTQPINEYATLFGLGGNVQMPQFQQMGTPQLAQTDVLGPINMQYQGQLANFNAQNQARNSTMGNLFGLGGSLGAAAIMSDIRLKTDITRIGTEKGIPVYTFRYRNDPHGIMWRGVMAQDILEIMPDAVEEIGDYLGVDYGKIGIEFGRIH